MSRAGSPSGILKPVSREPRAAAYGEETATVLSWHSHARRVRAADVSLGVLALTVVGNSSDGEHHRNSFNAKTRSKRRTRRNSGCLFEPAKDGNAVAVVCGRDDLGRTPNRKVLILLVNVLNSCARMSDLSPCESIGSQAFL